MKFGTTKLWAATASLLIAASGGLLVFSAISDGTKS
jgi:hypothetical protein